MGPLMPKATAIWLINNTSLTFKQIADFCQIHPLEVQGIADEEVAVGLIEEDPIRNGQLTLVEIKRCEADPQGKLQLNDAIAKHIKTVSKKGNYTPVARRQDKPSAILWFLKNHPDIKDSQIIALIGTTKSTINTIKNKEHWNIANIRPKDPVLLGLCSQSALTTLLQSIKTEEEIQANK